MVSPIESRTYPKARATNRSWRSSDFSRESPGHSQEETKMTSGAADRANGDATAEIPSNAKAR